MVPDGFAATAISGENRSGITTDGDGREEEQEVLTAQVEMSPPLFRFILDKQFEEGMSKLGLPW